MNGIKYDQFKNFEKKWKLVSVRFRKDTEEMRFTYANPIAYKALLEGNNDYPEGAVFGKLGVRTGHDPLFESSVVPHGARRYQLMVRNEKKYLQQSGWGYALFDERGIPFPEDHQAQVVACASCHNVAKERGYVFSQILNIAPRKPEKTKKIKFEMVATDTLPAPILELIPRHFNFVRIMQGEMVQSLFQGTLEEIRPLLASEAYESRQPAILKNAEGTRFSVVYPENLGSFCNEYGKSGLYMKSIFTNINDSSKKMNLSFCQTGTKLKTNIKK